MMNRFTHIVVGLLGFMLMVVAVESVVPSTYVPTEQDLEPKVKCIGEPITVAEAYNGGVLEPWSCRPQCDGDIPRYVLYQNGMATQCEPPPGCNDRGEDLGETCEPPSQKS